MIGIYKIINPNNKVYVGQSTNIKNRFKHYESLDERQIKLYNSFQKYGIDNHQFEIIEECSEDILDEREIYWGTHYNVLGDNGLNLRLGNGRGSCSEETKHKIGINNKGKGVKTIIQYDLEGNYIREWSSAKEIEKQLNIKNTDISSCCNNGKSRTAGGYIWKFKLDNLANTNIRPHKHNKKVTQHDMNNNFIKEWNSVKDAGNELNIHPTGISQCCVGKIKHFKKYIWKYGQESN